MLQQFLLAGFILTADQVTKVMVARRLAVGEAVPVGPGVRIRHVVARFPKRGLVHNGIALFLLWSVAVGGIVLAAHWGYVFERPAAQMGLSAALAGAASNLHDRLRNGVVIDFVELGWWPIFNLADVAITLGVMAAILFISGGL
jgi:signal peptidase II